MVLKVSKNIIKNYKLACCIVIWRKKRMLLWLNFSLVWITKFMIFLSIKTMQILLVCFILPVKLKGKCRVATQMWRLTFLQEELIHGSTTMDVQPHHLLHQVGWHLLRPTTAASLELLPQIQQLGRPQQQRVPHHPPSLLHLQAEWETSNVTAAKGLDMLCVVAPPSIFGLDNGNVYSVLLLRNDGQEQNGVAFAPATFGFQNSSS
jgi:hypothetical protein